MSRRWALASSALVVLSLAACESDDVHTVGPNGRDAFDRYVAVGTSVSMGTQSDGNVYFQQVNSWPAQLSRAAFATFTQPLISSSPDGGTIGCQAPLIAPLTFGRRFGGGPATIAAADSLRCSPLFANITLPTNNVAIDGARAYTALYFTPDSAAKQKVGRAQGLIYARVLPVGRTQITAMRAQNPTLVSVELGANELLGAASGILIPSTNGKDGTYVPATVFGPIYDKIIDSVKATGAKAILVAPGIPDIGAFPLFRKGSEIAAQAPVLLGGFRVTVLPDCGTTSADNLIALPKLLGTISFAAANPTVPVVPFSCADVPGTADGVLSTAEQAVIKAEQAAITTYIKGKATANGYAYMELGVLYNTVKTGTTFSVSDLLTSNTPYGPNISLDGVHPSNAGHQIIAREAAAQLDATYGFDITVP